MGRFPPQFLLGVNPEELGSFLPLRRRLAPGDYNWVPTISHPRNQFRGNPHVYISQQPHTLLQDVNEPTFPVRDLGTHRL